jgi:Rrf2 family iron-sulfur cluster assembly transcriptional regulator
MAKMGKDGTPVSIRQLSEKEKISPVFLEQIFYKLRKAGIVDSVRGPGGGFRFSRPLSELTVKEILDAAGEGLTLSPCGKKHADCSNMNDCVSFLIWAEATTMVNEYFDSLRMDALLKKYSGHFLDVPESCPE